MKIITYPNDVSELLAWAGKFPYTRYREDKPPKAFCEWAKEQMPPENSDIHFWTSYIHPIYDKMTSLAGHPMSTVDWVKGFPHKHSISMGWEKNIHALMTYLQPAEMGGEVALSGYTDGPYKLYKPYSGMTVIVDSEEWHGVKPVLRGERIAVLATGFPLDFDGKIPGFRD